MRGWSLRYDRFEPEQEGVREALCTLGNGYFATRGAGEEAEADDIHYPGTYLAAGYNRLSTEIAGRVVDNEDLVNFPNWLQLKLRPCPSNDARPDESNWFNLRAVDILSFRQELDLRCGVLERAVRFRDREGRITTINSRRFVHMEHEHLAAIRLVIQPENWSGRLAILSGLDGRVVNAGVERYRQLRNDHLESIAQGLTDDDIIWLLVRTNQSRIEMAQAARTLLFARDEPVDGERSLIEDERYIGRQIELEVSEGVAVTVEKTVALYTSRDHAVSECSHDARLAAREADAFDRLLERHTLAWRHLWQRCDILLSERGSALQRANEPTTQLATHNSQLNVQMILRLHIFHLLQTASMNSIEHDFGIPARGLHGEAYRGHVFWDELFIFPFLNLRIPEITRALLRYRYRRLPAARQAAREAGYHGAMFPWQSGSDGREETQTLHLNPRSGRWLPDHTHLQRHVNSAIAYNIWQYMQATGDREFLASYGAEMFLEIARFWASIATYNGKAGRYEIRNVVGPDEYHERYPGSDEPGIHNNAYTNVMAAWTLCRAGDLLDMLEPHRREELFETLELEESDVDRWCDMSEKMLVVFHDASAGPRDGRVISQFAGYADLEELDWERYRREYGRLHRLDRILEAEGDDVNRYKASKQADVLMLFYLFSPHELRRTFERLGYELDDDAIARNIDYYLHRTDHGSTLSRVVHSWVLARWDSAHSWELFSEALESDISDIQGGTTREGIHLGAMAGTVDLVQLGFTGLEVRGPNNDELWFDPVMPEQLGDLRLRLRFRGNWLNITVTRHDLTVAIDSRPAPGIAHGETFGVTIGFAGKTHRLMPGECKRFEYAKQHA